MGDMEDSDDREGKEDIERRERVLLALCVQRQRPISPDPFPEDDILINERGYIE